MKNMLPAPTIRMLNVRKKSTRNSLEQSVRALIDRRTVNRKLKQLYDARGKSSQHTIRKQLFDMFDALGIPYEMKQSDLYYVNLVKNAQIQNPGDVMNGIVKAIYRSFDIYYSPQDYMKRLVDRLSAPEDRAAWEGDSLRLRILKQFMKYGNYLTYERMQTAQEMKAKKDKAMKKAEARLENEPADTAGAKKRRSRRLKQTTVVSIYQGRAVIRKYIKEKLGRMPRNEEEALAQIDDGIFDAFYKVCAAADTWKKRRELRQPDHPYALIRLADELAEGRFRTDSVFRKGLYLFAMVYNMTYYSGEEESVPLYDTDIEKNLFEKYYTNNLMRYITDAQNSAGEPGGEPTGRGINYKNFAEMVYIYYISSDYSPQEKIAYSDQMIEQIKAACYSTSQAHIQRTDATNYYADLMTGSVLKLPEKEFAQFLIQNYDCNIYIRTVTGKDGKPIEERKSALQLQNEQNTAFKAYQSILSQLECTDMPIESCTYGLYFIDVSAEEKFDIIKCLGEEKNETRILEFTQLIKGIHQSLGNTVKEQYSSQTEQQEHKNPLKMIIPALRITRAEDVTRTALITAFYYMFNAQREMDQENEKWCGFGDMLEAFKKRINVYLEEAHYQPFSSENIFDIVVAFSSYAYLNN